MSKGLWCRRGPYSTTLPRCESTGKIRYRNERAALLALQRAVDSRSIAETLLGDGRRSRRKESRCYRCPHCFYWHLTSKGHQKRKRRKNRLADEKPVSRTKI